MILNISYDEINLCIMFESFPGNTNKRPMTVNMAG